MRKVFKITLTILLSIVVVLAGIVVFINTPAGQNFVRSKAEHFLAAKIHSEVKIGYLNYGLPKFVVLSNVLIRDRAGDTLLAVKKLKLDVALLQLLHRKLDVQSLVLQGVNAHVYRNAPDTFFNYTFIAEAFAGNNKDTVPSTDTSRKEPFAINVDQVLLDDIRLRYDDFTGGTLLAADIRHLALKMRALNLDSMFFAVKDLQLSGLVTSYRQDTSMLPAQPKDTGKAKLQLVADNIDLNDIELAYTDNKNKLDFQLNLGSLGMQLNKFDLSGNQIDLKRLNLANTSAILTFGAMSKPPGIVDTIIKKDTTEGWHVTAGAIRLAGINYRMNDANKARQLQGIDYAHLDARELALNLDNLNYGPDSISGKIGHFAVKEQSGVVIRELKSHFLYTPTGVILNQLLLETPVTILRDHAEVHYPSVAAIKDHPELMTVNVQLNRCIAGFSDLLLFVPDLKKQEIFRKYPDTRVRLDAGITGAVNNLNISNLYLLLLNTTELQLNGKLKGLPDPDKLAYDLNITRLSSGRQALSDFVPDSVLQSVRLPDRFSLNGKVAGNLKDYTVDVAVKSTDGDAYIKGTLATSAGAERERYNLLVQTSKLNAGRILKQDSLLGEVSAAVTIKGTSFNVKKMSATVNGAIGSAAFKGYTYHDVVFGGQVAQQKGVLQLSVKDTNLQVKADARIDLNGKYPAVLANIMIDSLDARALNLYSSELRVRGLIHADFPVLDPDYPKGKFTWNKPIINANGRKYFPDSIYLLSAPEAGMQHIVADLGVLSANISGHMPLTKVGAVVTERLNRSRAALPRPDPATVQIASENRVEPPKADSVPDAYDLKLNAVITDQPLLHSLLPDLQWFDSIHVDGTLNKHNLLVNVTIPRVEYGANTLMNGLLTVKGTDSALAYNVTADKVAAGGFAMWYVNIGGLLDQTRLTTKVSIADSARKERFALAGSLTQQGDSQIIHLDQGLTLNYQVWDVDAANSIVLAGKGFYISGVNISNRGQFIKAGTDGGTAAGALKIAIGNFNLSNITDIAGKDDTLLANGLLNADIAIANAATAPQVSGDITIKDLSVKGDSIGDLQVTVAMKDAAALQLTTTLKGHENDIAIAGNYYLKTNNGNDFDIKLDVNALSLQSIEAIAMHQIRYSKGFIRGSVTVKGKATAPQIDGEIHTDNLQTTVSMLNSRFRLPAEKIVFSGSTATFKKFTMMDSLNNKAYIDGTVDFADLADPALDMRIKATRWHGLHSTEGDNKTFYGDLYLTTNLDINGSALSPDVDGNINILKGTNFTVVTPEGQQQIESARGIVRFVNMKDTARAHYLAVRKKPTVKRKLAPGSQINVNINIDKDAALSLVIDKSSGDFISVKGEANLNASITSTGGIGLTGNYDIHSGAYQLNYNFIKRKFSIKDGSSITFAGDPVKGGLMNITAIYEANVPPFDLIERQVTDVAQLNYYKQRIPFEVDLNLKGPLLKPLISFDVVLPDNKVYPLASDQLELIQGKLTQIRNDTSELNKQVFALLILNRFVSDDPFSSGASQSVGFTALQSVSTFIGEQLNDAASHFVKGVDFSVDLATTQDYTTGDMRQRTDLNLAASKRLLNDRLKLTLGNNFELEGPKSNNEQTSYIPSNLAADYLLSSDGKYTLRAYRRAYDEGVLQGYVTETGLNFIVSLDYNRLRSAVRNKKNKHQGNTAR